MRGWIGLAVFGLGGCTTEHISTVTVEVLAAPPMPHGFYYKAPVVYGNGDEQVRMYLSNVPDLCGRYADFERALQDREAPGVAWPRLFPEDFWQALVVIRLEDYWTGLEATEVAVVEDFDLDPPVRTAHIELAHFRASLDEAFFEGAAPTSDYVEVWPGEGGSIDVEEWVPPRPAHGTFSTTLLNPIGFRIGDLDAQFDVPRCGDWERVIRSFGYIL